eukprot:CAMPEP_0201938324 /NCGR_PEP_ID=MMETSP0903-20130614/41194_1 /ASSEMBLY_ACC=CAM_ASM_000552 /TAXON_ID=420261 /ORGANISM="Thalassiosira antarctica, Strain CCMP982" /LENGTH=45 /DNA_ID= /DNA_START= /DNA_END= /DNA_ORIENTATION=
MPTINKPTPQANPDAIKPILGSSTHANGIVDGNAPIKNIAKLEAP